MTPTFENIQVNVDEIPQLEFISYNTLEKDYLKVSLIILLIVWLIIGVGLIIFLLFLDIAYPSLYNLIGLAGLSLILAFSFWAVYVGFGKKGYALRQRDIIYKKGIFWKSLTTIPFNRVQHCEVKQGPIDRIFDLSQLNIFTAGGSQSDLTIPGLTPEKAQALKNFIIKKTGQDESE
jgi:membrane protein YdbS with pleckstrin-like domain